METLTREFAQVSWVAEDSPVAEEAREYGRIDARQRVVYSRAFEDWADHIWEHARGDAAKDLYDTYENGGGYKLRRWYSEGYEEVSPGDYSRKVDLQDKMSLAKDAYRFGYFLVPTDRVLSYADWRDQVVEDHEEDPDLGTLLELLDREFQNGTQDRMLKLDYRPL